MQKLSFDFIISDKTHYGVIWKGTHNGTVCAIKVVLLDTGLHYNKKSKEFTYHGSKVASSVAMKYFNKNQEEKISSHELKAKVPFLHTKYQKRKSMSMEKFTNEVKMLKKVSSLGFAPELFYHWVDQKSFPIHYGFIVMEYMSLTLKDVILERNLKRRERDYIKKTIHALHSGEYFHGDLKPSNIGVNFSSSGRINRILIIDWAKGEHTKNDNKFRQDIANFSLHFNKNLDERKRKN